MQDTVSSNRSSLLLTSENNSRMWSFISLIIMDDVKSQDKAEQHLKRGGTFLFRLQENIPSSLVYAVDVYLHCVFTGCTNRLICMVHIFQGYLPESMFDRILTGPIVPEEVSRRGRRPKNPLAKAAAAATNPSASSLGLNPVLSNGLLSGLDLTSIQAFQQSLQLTTGLMGLPSDAGNLAASNLAAMFPMMLSGVPGLPNLLGMNNLLGNSPQEGAEGSEEKAKATSCGKAAEASDSKAAPQTSDTKGERTENTTPSSTSSSSSSSTTPSSASAASAASSHQLSLNPLLLSSMLYPGMLLTPGLNLPVSATQPQNSNTDTTFSTPPPPPPATSQSTAQKSKQLAVKEEEEDELEGTLDEEDEESAEQKENSGPEVSSKAESSSSSSDTGSSSSSSDDSDSSEED